jgi:hypothetical protein
MKKLIEANSLIIRCMPVLPSQRLSSKSCAKKIMGKRMLKFIKIKGEFVKVGSRVVLFGPKSDAKFFQGD